MDYELLQRHGVTDIECNTGSMEGEPWHSAIGAIGPIGSEIGDAGIYNIHPIPRNIFTLRFELDGMGLERLEHALRLLEEQDVKADVDEEGPFCTFSWDAACDEECDKAINEVGDYDGEEWDDECSNNVEEPANYHYVLPDNHHYVLPAHYKYVLKYR